MDVVPFVAVGCLVVGSVAGAVFVVLVLGVVAGLVGVDGYWSSGSGFNVE